ncbi:cytochrome c oxidase cbb3-type subunit 3 [Reichenbachiella agariperforans]|uniref:Cytochrome c oxidase cbb3-type subunit 3 n=1 Tax=Reichenbachiella agariperforans TaxID=156994 RepID=A0A1M6JAM1_REIAG|nr:cbb3-type cytochrome c oxidase N-terminal domain-containing protein [Reichenbachiella agariperforans]SHJ43724.1 cytochrome c oxidase cbb3-type subunit 3 [Reichenbachiella agariperforans]
MKIFNHTYKKLPQGRALGILRWLLVRFGSKVRNLSPAGYRPAVKLLLCAVLVLCGSLSANAQSDTMGISSNDMMLIMMSLVLLVVLLVLLVAIVLLNIIKMMLNTDLEKKGITIDEPSLWKRLNDKLTGAVPLEEEEAIELDHDYDGIKELDNHLPPWWKWLFYITIVFAIAYMVNYHVLKLTPLQDEEYAQQVAKAEAAKSSSQGSEEQAIDESNISFSDDAALLTKGKTIYERNCVACHKAGGEGGIGPNLTDDYWLHGGSAQDTYHTISNGVVEKGMIAWKEVLSPANMNAVNSYIYTLRGTNPANAKAPQGELYQEETTTSAATDSTAVAE